MKNVISKLSCIVLVPLLLAGCGFMSGATAEVNAAFVQCEDMGEEYVDSFIFIGESTTAHLKSRAVLKGGEGTTQVWTTASGTMMLDSTTSNQKIIYPPTNTQMTISEAAALEKPQRILLTFGLNGAVSKIRRGEEYFKSCYRELIEGIRAASPSTEIILQSCFPISSSMDTTAYGIDAATLNESIRTINGWTHSLAAELGLGYLNTAEDLCDKDGYLKPEYDAGDGHHLTKEAYLTMLRYLRTHGRRSAE